MATGDKSEAPITGRPEVELPDGSKVTDWSELKGVGPGGDATATARYKPNTDYAAGDPIFEPDPNDDEIYVWRADADFRTGAEPDFDGTGFTQGEKVESPLGNEGHIIQGDVTPRLFSGSSIGKAVDVIEDGQLMPRAFRAALATQIYGSTGGGKIGTAVDPANGLIYAVRVGRTVTDDTIPSLSSNWIQLYPGRVPPNAIADILQIRFDALVALTGLQLWSADTQELLMWDTSATPENVAPRRTYSAAAEPIPFIQGKWVVISPQPPGGEDSHVLLADEAATVGTNVVPCNESLTAVKNNYMHLEVYSLSDGFGNPLHSPGAILLTEHLTHDVPFQIDLAGRDLVFRPQDNGAGNMTLVNESANAGAQNFKVYGVKKQTTVVTVDPTALTVDMAGVAVGDGAEFADDGAGGLKLVGKAHQTTATVTLNGTTDADDQTTIPYAGDVKNGYLVEIEVSADRWLPQNYGDRTDEAANYFQVLYDKGQARFEMWAVGTALQGKPYRIAVYGTAPAEAAPDPVPSVERVVAIKNPGFGTILGDFNFMMSGGGVRSIQIRTVSGTIAYTDFNTYWSAGAGGDNDAPLAGNWDETWRYAADANMTAHNHYQHVEFIANGWFYHVHIVVGPGFNDNRLTLTRWRVA